MNPQNVQDQALLWIGVIVAVLTAGINAYAQIKATISQKIQGAAIDNNTKRLDGHADKIDTLLLNTPPPTMVVTAAAPVASPSTVTVYAQPPMPSDQTAPDASSAIPPIAPG